jgi:hypothetical protein
MLKTLKEFRARIRYLIDRAFAREFTGQLLLLFVLVVTVTLFGMTAIFFGLFSAENTNISGIHHDIDKGFFDSLWWSLNQVLPLRGFERMYHATGVVLAYAFFLSLMGLVVFSVLISLINNTMLGRIEALRRGETPVLERDHVLVLGWNNKVFSVLRQLARLEPGIKAVILAPREIYYMQEELRVAGIQRPVYSASASPSFYAVAFPVTAVNWNVSLWIMPAASLSSLPMLMTASPSSRWCCWRQRMTGRARRLP